LFLSGIRVGAFVTLPLVAVDLDNLKIKQWPRLWVRTKHNKHATTYLLNIPDLLEVVREWDYEVRAALPDTGLWFAPYSPETGKFDSTITSAGECRYKRPAKDLKDWLQRVGLLYHSPHKFRHGFAVLALINAKDIQALKAVSQNLMHSNLSITDGVYGILSQIDVGKQMSKIGQKIISGE
jgi:site-specific recombinase XerC